MVSFDPVRSIQRGLAVLRAISEYGPIGASEIGTLCHIPQPTTVRLIETLIAEGYVHRLPNQATYKVTGRTLSLSRGFDPRSRLAEIAMPVVDQLHLDIGWPSNLAVYDVDAMVIVHSNRASLGLSMPSRIGARIPMLATGVGLVTLAGMPPSVQRQTLARAKVSGSRWDSDPALLTALPERLEEIRKQGHAFAHENYLDEVYQSRIWAVAVPIPSPDGRYLAISSLVLRMAGDRKKLLGKILPKLSTAAENIHALLIADLN